MAKSHDCSSPDHHVHDAASFVHAVERACNERGLRLTAIRARVLSLVAEAGKPIIVLPYQVDNNDMKMWAEPSYTPDQWLKYAIDNLDWALAEGKHEVNMMSIGLHLRIIGRPGRIWALEEFFRHVRQHDGVWVTTRKAIAEHFAATVPA